MIWMIVLHIRRENHDMEAKAAWQALEILLVFMSARDVDTSPLFYRGWKSSIRKSDADSRTQVCLMSAGRPDRFLLETDSP